MIFELEQSNETLTANSGLILIGQMLEISRLRNELDNTVIKENPSPDIKNADIVFSYAGLICQGKNDFDNIEEFRDDPFFHASLLLKSDVPASSTLRQRLDLGANYGWNKIVLRSSLKLLKLQGTTVTPSLRDLVSLDIDVSCFDNSKTKKEGISRTYRGFDGYAPIFAYLGKEGYAVNLEFREGKQHSQKNTSKFLEETIDNVSRITSSRILLRMDSGFDSIDNIKVCLKKGTEYIIKRNMRKETPEEWLSIAERKGMCFEERLGKKVYTGDTFIDRGLDKPLRAVFKVIKRTSDAQGQMFLVPDIEVQTIWTSLSDAPEVIFGQYRELGTSEQFHSELKTDLNLERLPSGKFATNDLVLHIAAMCYNFLRFIGQQTLLKKDTPLRTKVQRRRVRTVVQNIITIAAKLVYHARRHKLRFGKHSPWFNTLKRLYISIDST